MWLRRRRPTTEPADGNLIPPTPRPEPQYSELGLRVLTLLETPSDWIRVVSKQRIQHRQTGIVVDRISSSSDSVWIDGDSCYDLLTADDRGELRRLRTSILRQMEEADTDHLRQRLQQRLSGETQPPPPPVDETARLLAQAVIDGQIDAVWPLVDRLQEVHTRPEQPQ
jgi:hypothetical protein